MSEGTELEKHQTEKANEVSKVRSSYLDNGDEDDTESPGCGIFGKYPLMSLLIFAVCGIALGVGLSYWRPEDNDEAHLKKEIMRWVGLLGDIWIRGLKAVVLPLVFFNVVLATVEMINLGKASKIGWFTIGTYLATTVSAAIFGVISTAIFSRFYSSIEIPPPGPEMIKLGCNEPGTFLTEGLNGTLSCTADYVSKVNTEFIFNNVNTSLVTSSSARASLGLSETLYTGVFHKLITSNIFKSFVGGDLLAIVFFAIIFGIALGRLSLKKKDTTLLSLVKEIDVIFLQIIVWLVLATPFAVFSLIASRLGKDDDLATSLSNIGYLFAATLVGMLFQLVLFHGFAFKFLTGINPFLYLKHIGPAFVTAFATSSSAATLPVTMKCVESTGKVPKTIGNFVLPLGATINMDGTSIYIPAACIWLAFLNGHQPNVAQYIILIILGTVGSAGAAPVPSASLVLIVTAYNTVFNESGTPDGFSFILAIDWLVDSFRTMLNVAGDSVVAAIVSHYSELEVESEEKMQEEVPEDLALDDEKVASA